MTNVTPIDNRFNNCDNNPKGWPKGTIWRSSHQRCSTRKGVLRNFTKSTGKHLCQSLFFNKVADLRPATLVKKRLWHRCFPVNFVEFLRTPFCTDYLWWLLLVILTRIDWELLSLKRSVKLEIFELQQEICMTIHHTGVDLGVGNGLRPLYS